MYTNARLALAFAPPSPDEAQALRVAGNYLVRAGSLAASYLFSDVEGSDVDRLADLSDSLLTSALVCADLTELPESSRSE